MSPLAMGDVRDTQCGFLEAAVGLAVPSLSFSRLVGGGCFSGCRSAPAEGSLGNHLEGCRTAGGTRPGEAAGPQRWSGASGPSWKHMSHLGVTGEKASDIHTVSGAPWEEFLEAAKPFSWLLLQRE